MSIQQTMWVLALRHVAEGACRHVGGEAAGNTAGAVSKLLIDRFLDQSQRLPMALQRANLNAWRALEVSLAGDSVWDRCSLLLASGDQKAFRQQVAALLEQTSFVSLTAQINFKPACLKELKQLRSQKSVAEPDFRADAVAEQLGPFTRFSDPQALMEAEWQAVGRLAGYLRDGGLHNLATLVELRSPNGSPPLLVVAVRYFFRRCVEDDPKLAQGLAFAQMEKLQHSQEEAFASLRTLLDDRADALDQILAGLTEVVTETRDVVLDVRAEQAKIGEQNRDIYDAVQKLQQKLDLIQTEVRPRDSLSIRNDSERQLVRELVLRYRSLPEDERRRLPALLNAVGKLEVAAGDFESARKDFGAVAELVGDPSARAEAHHNAYRAALEARDWETALRELRAAVEFDARRFQPFPFGKYIPQRILGAGGFGVAFLCKHRYMNAPLVVKTLAADELDQGVERVFGEAQTLKMLDHPAVIRVQECDFADGDGPPRPYLVMDFFDGQTLEGRVQEKGPLSVAETLAVALPVARGLEAAHGQNILHRDVKPANLLVRHTPETGWSVKLIDFGLALRREALQASISTKTLSGSSIAGTLDYGAPEQMGKLPGVAVGPRADVYGFGKTCCYALFGTPSPTLKHWRQLPEALAELLGQCLEDKPEERPATMKEVADRLAAVAGGGNTGLPAPVPLATPAPMPTPAAPPTTTVQVATGGLSPEQRRVELEVVTKAVAGCLRCPDLARARSKTVPGSGPLDADIAFFGEAPGYDEDRSGEPFVGASGQLLTRFLQAAGLRRDEVYVSNLIKCRTPGGRPPQAVEFANCRGYLDRQLELVRPKVVCALGTAAAQNLLGRMEPIKRLRGRFYTYRGLPVLCMFHPAYLLPGRSPESRRDFWDDLKLVLSRVGRPAPATPPRMETW